MKIGICGGTFDPFHRGHLDPILAVRREMQWERVIYVPASKQPFKAGQTATSGYHRFAMAVLATQADSGLYVSPVELERGGTSYTVDTLEELRGMYPDATFDWIIGEDNVPQLGQWKNVDRILQLARLVVLSRGGKPPSAVPVVYARNKAVPISATEIRHRVRAGEPIDMFVDPLVSRYIRHYGLYKEVTT